MRRFLATLIFLFVPSIAWAQCTGVFGAGQVCGSVSGGPPTAVPTTSVFTFTLNSATVDAGFCSTVGSVLTRQTSGWICSTAATSAAGAPNGVTFGAPTLNTSQINITTTNGVTVSQPFVFNATTPISSPLDWRWTYTSSAPTDLFGKLLGPNFYTVLNPSGSSDNHVVDYAGVNGTVYSENSGVLALMIGGNFSAIRRNTGGGGSTNPVIGAVGNSVGGIVGDAASATGDGLLGGMFSAYQNSFNPSSLYDPVQIGSVTGLLGRAIEQGPVGASVATPDAVGTGAYVGVEGRISNAYALYASIDSRTQTMSKAVNAYGLFIGPVAGAQNVNASLRTSTGTVIFGGNEALVGNLIGGTTVTALSKPTINKVWGGATGQFSEAAGGYQTTGTKTYTYQVVARFKTGSNSAGATAVSTPAGHLGFDDLSVSGQNNYIQWTPVEGATSYDIYRTAAGGTITNTTGKIANVPFDVFPFLNQSLAPSPPSYADAGAVGDSASPPAGAGAVLQIDSTPLADGGAGPGTGALKAGSLIDLSSPLQFGVNGGPQWQIDTNGNLTAVNDALYDIGQSGANRPRNLYLAGTAQVSPTTIASLSTCNLSAVGRMSYVTNGFSPVVFNQKVLTGSTSVWTWPVFCGTDPTSVNAFAWTYH